MRNNNQELLVFERDVQRFQQNVSTALEDIFQRQENIIKWMKLLSMQQELRDQFTKVEFGLMSCIDGRIPFTLISSEELRKSLDKVAAAAASDGLMLSIPAFTLQRYYKVRLADCVLTEKNLYVLANIPLTKNQWKVSEIIPVPYAFDGHTCGIESSESSVLATSSLKSVLLDGYFKNFCDLHHELLCRIPVFNVGVGRARCADALVRNKPVREVLDACGFHCSPSTALSLYEVKPGLIVATNAIAIRVTCPQFQKLFRPDKLGAVEIALTCNCSYNVDAEILTSSASCLQKDPSLNDVVSVIPDVWTGYDEFYRDVIQDWPANRSLVKPNWSVNANLRLSNLTVPEESVGNTTVDGPFITLAVFVGLLFLLFVFIIYLFSQLKV